MNNFWSIDKENYRIIQTLKEFVDFVCALSFASDADQVKASEIKRMIETIDKPEPSMDWNVCLDIFDREVQENKRAGVYWRSWSVYFENGILEVEAMTCHSEAPPGHWGDDFHYWAYIDFKKEVVGRRIYLDQEPDLFIQDAIGYQKYITETLNDIEVDIDIF